MVTMHGDQRSFVVGKSNKPIVLLSVCGCEIFYLRRLQGNKYSSCVSGIADSCLNYRLGKGCRLAFFVS